MNSVRILAAILGLSLLTACGQKGPLFLPKPVATPPVSHDVPPVETRKK